MSRALPQLIWRLGINIRLHCVNYLFIKYRFWPSSLFFTDLWLLRNLTLSYFFVRSASLVRFATLNTTRRLKLTIPRLSCNKRVIHLSLLKIEGLVLIVRVCWHLLTANIFIFLFAHLLNLLNLQHTVLII